MAKKEPFKFESNLEYVKGKLDENPRRVLNVIGQQLVREIRANELKTNYNHRTKILSKSLGWGFGWDKVKNKKDKSVLQIGFKMSIERNPAGVGPGIVGGIITGTEPDPLKPSVLRNKDLITRLIGEALDEIRKGG